LDFNFILYKSDINYIQSHIYMSLHCGYSVTKFSKAETTFVHDNESVSSYKHWIKFLGLSSNTCKEHTK